MTDLPASTQACKNCQTEYNGIFCPSCGQKMIDERFTIREGISNVFGIILNFDRGLWPTLYGLIKNPGIVLREYLNGITIKYYHPFRFLFLWLTLSVLLMAVTGINDYLQGEFSEQISGHPIPDILKDMLTVFNSYSHLLIASSMPLLALASWLFFRKQGYNYAEHLIVVSYAYGITVFLSIAFIPIYFLDKASYAWLSSINLLIGIGFFTYVYLSFFQGNRVLIFFKSLGVYFLYTIIYGAVMVALAISVFIYKASIDPEFKEAIKNEVKTG